MSPQPYNKPPLFKSRQEFMQSQADQPAHAEPVNLPEPVGTRWNAAEPGRNDQNAENSEKDG